MRVAVASLVPHPPILVSDVGGAEIGKIGATVDAMKDVSEKVSQVKAQTLVIVSPHSPVFADAFAIKTRPALKGSLARFGAAGVTLGFQNDIKLVGKILEEASRLDVPAGEFGDEVVEMGYSDELDHGVLVPLYYLRKGFQGSVVSISLSDLSYFKHYLFGLAVQKAAESLSRDIVFVASGDLSHCLTPDAPGGYNEKGRDFDHAIQDILQRGAFEQLFGIKESLIESAGECGFRSIVMLAGVLNGYDVKTNILSYEGPFGVGYLVAVVEPLAYTEDRDLTSTVASMSNLQMEQRISEESEPARLARRAVESYVQDNRIVSAPAGLPNFLLMERGAAFVSLKKSGVLRGCIGTTAPTQSNLAEEIIKNAIQAAMQDPRFPPVQPGELSELSYSVDVLEKPEKISDESALDPKKFGVIVESGFRKGLLLPDIEGVDTVEDQVNIAKRKAGIFSSEPVLLYRFKVTRYK